MNLLLLIASEYVSYKLGEQRAEAATENALLQNSPGYKAAKAAGLDPSAPTSAIKPNPLTDVNAMATGDVTPNRSTP